MRLTPRVRSPGPRAPAAIPASRRPARPARRAWGARRQQTLMHKNLILLLAFALTGCSSSSPPRITLFRPSGISHFRRDIELSLKKATDLQLGVRLVSVATDGLTTIEVLDTRDSFQARPGEYFVGAFGNEGLELVSASPERSEIVLRRRWAESR